MSSTKCEAGRTSGFPINISASASSLLSESNEQIQKLIVPTEFKVNWATAQNVKINISQTATSTVQGVSIPAVCQINGFDDIAHGTTLTYGSGGDSATYKCSTVLSIVKNQHPNFNLTMGAQALYEVILAFQITNKKTNPSSPDIILLTRPIVLISANDGSMGNTPKFWSDVNKLLTTPTLNTVQTNLDLSTVFGYNSTTLMPMASYQTCLPVKLLNSSSTPSAFLGSLTMRVNVVLNPIYITGTDNGLGKCSAVTSYTLITSGGGPLDIFGNSNMQLYQGKFFQFKDGSSTSDGFPTSSNINNYAILKSSYAISSLADITQKIEIAVPESLLGKSLADVAASSTLPVATKPANTKFKCYSIDPSSDIVNGQITIDPTTGQTLQSTLQQQSLAATGGITIPPLPSSGIKAADIEDAIVITMIVILSIGLAGYGSYIIYNLIYYGMATNNIIFHGLVLSCIIITFALAITFLVEKPH